jgi:uncharacterized membrane protein
MPINLATIQTPTSTPSGLRRRLKALLWIAMAGMTISVIFYSEVPLLRQVKERAYLGTIPLLIIPHILAGTTALLSGPLQFSSRVRRDMPKLHRVLGRAYVCAVLIAAPLAIIMSNHRRDPRAIHFVVANIVQAGIWIITTVAAFLAAHNRHFDQHREWMVRSYAVTFTFVGTRVLQPIPAWNRHSEAGFAIEIILITFMAILIPDLTFHCSAFTRRRS